MLEHPNIIWSGFFIVTLHSVTAHSIQDAALTNKNMFFALFYSYMECCSLFQSDNSFVIFRSLLNLLFETIGKHDQLAEEHWVFWQNDIPSLNIKSSTFLKSESKRLAMLSLDIHLKILEGDVKWINMHQWHKLKLMDKTVQKLLQEMITWQERQNNRSPCSVQPAQSLPVSSSSTHHCLDQPPHSISVQSSLPGLDILSWKQYCATICKLLNNEKLHHRNISSLGGLGGTWIIIWICSVLMPTASRNPVVSSFEIRLAKQGLWTISVIQNAGKVRMSSAKIMPGFPQVGKDTSVLVCTAHATEQSGERAGQSAKGKAARQGNKAR